MRIIDLILLIWHDFNLGEPGMVLLFGIIIPFWVAVPFVDIYLIIYLLNLKPEPV